VRGHSILRRTQQRQHEIHGGISETGLAC
jgi:hypothetical protein